LRKHKLLLISSNHLAITPGGLESYTMELYEAFRRSDEFEPMFLARTGQPFTDSSPYHGWSPLAMVNKDPNQYLFYTDAFGAQWDTLFGRWKDKQVLTRFFRDFLLTVQPDIVNFQHLSRLGYDAIRVTRDTLPDVPIVYTIHEYLPICHRDGQMVRTMNNELCSRESPRRCHECFPEISPQQFFMRKRFIQSQLAIADCLIAPSDYVRDRYVEWGIPDGKILVEPQGAVPVSDRLPDRPEARPRNRFAFFGQLNPYKGADILLEAIEDLGEEFDGHVTIFGANLDIQPVAFRERVEALLARDGSKVTMAGPYTRAELPKLMNTIDWVVVPSLWWETGPMVVVEAFQYGRPVICSDIGGMAEKVTHGQNGLHFRRADARDLAETMMRAAETPDLWEKLRAGIPPEPPRSMGDHVEALHRIYRSLLTRDSEERDGQGHATMVPPHPPARR
jgi:glycosyltransferase involved in cell wall biosynthesis